MKPYYQDDAVTIYCGDCRDVLPDIEKVDHVITDPPYEAEAHTLQRRVKRGGGVMVMEPLDFAPMDDYQRLKVSYGIGRIVQGWVLCFCQVEAAMEWRGHFEDPGGLTYKRTAVWVKPDGMPQYSGDRPGMGYESIVMMHAPGKSEWNGGGRHGVFVFNKNGGEPGPNEHPTQKPLLLMKELVVLFTVPGDLILDPYMGSGTTLRAAKDFHRKAIGIEINEKYCEIAARRMSQEVLPL